VGAKAIRAVCAAVQARHSPGVRLVSLQCGPASTHAPCIPAEDISSENVEETAAKLRSLDVLISVDTFAAHLAGALGVPVWLLLNAESDWRWMTDRTDSVWYPTMRLFRQSAPGQWPQVINSVVAALQALRRHKVGYQSLGTNNLI
jgi:ADP-heptose:LPS heptosyltransferase